MKKIFIKTDNTEDTFSQITFTHFDVFNPDPSVGWGMSETQLNGIGKVITVPDSCGDEECEIFSQLFNVPAKVDNTVLVGLINGATKELSYTYVDVAAPSKSPTEQLAELQAQVTALQETIKTLTNNTGA